MAKGPYLTGRITDMIAELYRADRQVKPGKAQEELLKKMKAEGLNEIFGSNYPSRSTVSKELKSLRGKDEARSPESKGLDQPWCLGSLGRYDISPEALPIVMAAFMRTVTILPMDSKEVVTMGESEELTVREAQWIARLYKLIDDPDLLRDWAWFYATQEWLAEVTGKPFITWEFDVELVRNPQWARDERGDFEREIGIWDIAEKYNADPAKLKDLNLSIKETERIAKSGRFRKEAQDEKGHEKRN